METPFHTAPCLKAYIDSSRPVGTAALKRLRTFSLLPSRNDPLPSPQNTKITPLVGTDITQTQSLHFLTPHSQSFPPHSPPTLKRLFLLHEGRQPRMTNFFTEADLDEMLHSTFFIKMCDDASWLYVEESHHEPEMNWLLAFWGGYTITPRFQGEVLFSRLLLPPPPPPPPTPLPPPSPLRGCGLPCARNNDAWSSVPHFLRRDAVYSSRSVVILPPFMDCSRSGAWDQVGVFPSGGGGERIERKNLSKISLSPSSWVFHFSFVRSPSALHETPQSCPYRRTCRGGARFFIPPVCILFSSLFFVAPLTK